MADPRIGEGVQQSDDGVVRLTISWEPGAGLAAALPPEYFEQQIPDPGALDPALPNVGPAEIVGVTAESTGEREITITFSDDLAALASFDRVGFALFFPDRRGFLDCTHSGMEDIYFLVVSVRITDESEIEQPQFDQGAILGPV